MLEFLIVQLVEPKPVPLLTNQTTAVPDAVLLFVMVMSREEVPLFEPSIMIQLAPFILKIELVLPAAGLIVTVLPLAGLIVTVLVALDPLFALIVIG